MKKYALLKTLMVMMMCFTLSSCDKVISMIIEEFNSEKAPAIPRQTTEIEKSEEKDSSEC